MRLAVYRGETGGVADVLRVRVMRSPPFRSTHPQGGWRGSIHEFVGVGRHRGRRRAGLLKAPHPAVMDAPRLVAMDAPRLVDCHVLSRCRVERTGGTGVKRKTRVLVLMVLLPVLVVACSSNREAPTASSPAAQPAAKPSDGPAAVSPTPTATKPGVEIAASAVPGGASVSVDVTVPPPEGVFAQSAAALAALQSYRYVTTFSFVAGDKGKPESGSVEVRGAVAAPDRQRMTWKDLETGEEFGLLRVGQRAWILDGAEWTAVPTLVADAASQAILVYVPAMSWGRFAEGMGTTSAFVGVEAVGGVPSRHYASTYRGWSEFWQGEITDAVAEVWIAEAGYPVRYRFAASGVDEDGNRGSLLWTMELTDVNAPVWIDAPQ